MASETLIASSPTEKVDTVTAPPKIHSHDSNPVQWAPLTGIPIERRLQMLAVCAWISLLFACLFVFIFLATYKFLWPVLIAYVTFIYFDKAPENGGRRYEKFRHWVVWKYFANYFPVTLIKEQDLDASKNYVFGYHPHGIISMGAFSNFATEATGFSKTFPGIKPFLLTLTSNFNIPLYRDYILSLGMAAVSRRSCEKILSSGAGHSIVIVIGGAAESLNARPGTVDLVLRKRLGFIRLAIKQKAELVPVFSFGENDLYDQVDNTKGSKVFHYQKKMQAILGFTMPLFHARGVFNLGKPIPVPTLEEGTEPTQEQLLAVQKLYIEELQSIYDKYKDVYAKDRKQELCIAD
ncbi:hypothetical protein INT47_005205 [Mucor saturninus]|uniref:Diacylglycerol O-acyltransferase n=1 Tax=Mucor saturninus TaxID=64648 RepID=A0A8H7V7U2_9FUNG|nr:hypothetical protein INT47_005205 [Mucor saturninus]